MVELAADVVGISRLLWFLRELGCSSTCTLTRSSSAIVAGYSVPTAASCFGNDLGKVVIKDDGTRELQRIVSTHSFYGSKNAFQDCVLIEASQEKNQMEDPDVEFKSHTMRMVSSRGWKSDESDGKDEECNRLGKNCEVWVAKVLAFVTVRSRCISPSGCTRKGSNEFREVAWVQYFDRVGKLDVLERALGCVKLKWSQTSIPLSELGPEEDNMFLDVLPVSTIRGRAHVVIGD